MSARHVRAFDYVNQPYEPVRDALRDRAQQIFQRATRAAETRTGDLAASLSVELAGIQISKDIAISVGAVSEDSHGSEMTRVTHIELSWQASSNPGLFPAMSAKLAVYPLSFTETQVELDGSYEPPMGVLGGVVDAVVGHRLAEASVHRFVRAVVEQLREELAKATED